MGKAGHKVQIDHQSVAGEQLHCASLSFTGFISLSLGYLPFHYSCDYYYYYNIFTSINKLFLNNELYSVLILFCIPSGRGGGEE